MTTTYRPRALTDRQLEVLQAIHAIRQETNTCPTVRELGAELDIGNPNGVLCHLRALRKRGLLWWDRRFARTLQLTPEGLAAIGAAAAEDMVAVPRELLGEVIEALFSLAPDQRARGCFGHFPKEKGCRCTVCKLRGLLEQ